MSSFIKGDRFGLLFFYGPGKRGNGEKVSARCRPAPRRDVPVAEFHIHVIVADGLFTPVGVFTLCNLGNRSKKICRKPVEIKKVAIIVRSVLDES